MKRTRYFRLGSAIVLAGLSGSHAFAATESATRLRPGGFQCTNPTAEILRGRCVYRVLDYGANSVSILLERAKRAVKPLPKQRTFNNVEPRDGGYGTIEWWFENEDGTPDEKANQAMGEFFSANDLGPTIQNLPKVEITTTMYEFDKGQERKLGLEVTSFLGKRQLDEKPGSLVQSLTQGLFKAAIGIGNPLSSLLQLGIDATMNASNSKAKIDKTTTCEIGTTCQFSELATYYYYVGGMPAPREEAVGFRMSAVPQIDPTQPGLIRLESLNVMYSKLTGEPNAPVVTYQPKMSSGTTFYSDEILVIGSDSTEQRNFNGKLLEVASTSTSTKFLIMMKVKLLMPRGEANPYPQNTLLGDDRSFTREELEKLPEGELTVEDILRSIEPVCYKNIINAEIQEPVCGFKLMKLDRKYMNYRLRFTLRKGGFLFGGNKLMDEGQRSKIWKMSDVYDGKGYYALPEIVSDKPEGSYTLVVELDKSNPIAKARRKAEPVKGIQFSFGLTRGLNPPLEFDSNQIRVIK